MTVAGRERLRVYADGGILARRWPLRLELPLPVSAMVAATPVIVALVVADDVSVTVGAATIWWVVVSESGAGVAGPLAWLYPPLVRAGEYGIAVAAVALGAPNALPALFVALAALAYHHYDVVYRLRQVGQAPPAWLELALLGHGVRLLVVVGVVVVASGAAAATLWVLAAHLAILAVGESLGSWRRAFRDGVIT